jgi:hypothetical protein
VNKWLIKGLLIFFVHLASTFEIQRILSVMLFNYGFHCLGESNIGLLYSEGDKCGKALALRISPIVRERPHRTFVFILLFQGGFCLKGHALSSGIHQPKGSIFIASNSKESSRYFSINFVILLRWIRVLSFF